MSPYTLTGRLDGASPIILASPHSGTHLPADFLASARLPVPMLRRIEDSHVGQLLAKAAQHGIPLIEATHSRAVIDLNRAEDELDPAMFDAPVTASPRVTDRVRRGYGLFPRVAGPNMPIHPRRLPVIHATSKIESLHRPWHDAISAGLDAARSRHGFAVLLDVHSMPSLDGPAPARLVIGDLHGRTAAAPLVNWLEAQFTAAGLGTVRNNPYAGGHTTERHGTPGSGLHAVQLEFDRSLYMDTGSLKPHAGFAPLADVIAGIFGRLAGALATMGLAPDLPLAAE